jgi:hypothetical protein
LCCVDGDGGQVARKAAEEVKKVKEVAFIQGLKAQDRMYCLQERLEDGSARRQEHLEAVRGRQRDAEVAKEQVTPFSFAACIDPKP